MKRRNRNYMKFMDSKHRNNVQTMRRVYRDSVSNYKLMKRMHMDTHVASLMVLDARRKYRDAEEEGFLAKIKAAVGKLNDKITQTIKEHPRLAKLYKVWLKISASLTAIYAGYTSGAAIRYVIKNLSAFKEAWKQNAPGVAGAVVVTIIGGVLIPALSAYLNWKLAREVERREAL